MEWAKRCALQASAGIVGVILVKKGAVINGKPFIVEHDDEAGRGAASWVLTTRQVKQQKAGERRPPHPSQVKG